MGDKLDETKNNFEHVEYVTNRRRDLDRFNKLINMISVHMKIDKYIKTECGRDKYRKLKRDYNKNKSQRYA